ncbi:sulfotransferase [Cyanobium sp. LEGE 06143]|nr:sulfotransferase [Cyanobium sp. LEGE 06143]
MPQPSALWAGSSAASEPDMEELLASIARGLEGADHDTVARIPANTLPNFIVIGAAKSATTTLTRVLGRHPDIFMAKPKEPKFFGRRYDKGWSWYAKLFEDGSQARLRGEGSTMYSSTLPSFEHTAALMHTYLPATKIIYMTRHPLDRLVSQWRHIKGKHPATREFYQLLETSRLQHFLIGCSLYYQRISSFRRYFPDEQILCLTFEDLLTSPQHTLQTVLDFLALPGEAGQLLNGGTHLPLVNEAGQQGRRYVDKPEWPWLMKWRVARRLKADTRKFLGYIDKPADYWKL